MGRGPRCSKRKPPNRLVPRKEPLNGFRGGEARPPSEAMIALIDDHREA